MTFDYRSECEQLAQRLAQATQIIEQSNDDLERLINAEAALIAIDRIVHVPTKKTRHIRAGDHFQSDFDAIRKLTAPWRGIGGSLLASPPLKPVNPSM